MPVRGGAPATTLITSAATYGATGDGVTDDASAINRAIAAASPGGTVYLPATSANVYCVGTAQLDSSKSNVKLLGQNRSVTLKHIGANPIMQVFANLADGYTFENLTFDGNASIGGSASLNLAQAQNLTFRSCIFRNMIAGPTFTDAYNGRFIDCDFYGTDPTVMQSGVQDPTPVAGAAYRPAIVISTGNQRIIADNCRFHFCSSGIGLNGNTTHLTRDVLITNCRFRSDWWNQPYIEAQFTVTGYSAGTYTVGAGGLTGTMTGARIASFRTNVGSDTAFSAISRNLVTFANPISNLVVGDSIETADGRRAEILNVIDTTHVQLQNGWEATNTYEFTTAPALATAFRISRYYAAGVGTSQPASDTTFTLAFEPINPFTGARLIADAGLSAIGLTFRISPVVNYGGVQCNGGVDNLVIEKCRLRGSWADQLSCFDTTAPKFVNNWIEYTQDEGITCTRNTRAVIMGNTIRNTGTSGVFISTSGVTVIGNTIYNWGQVNRGIKAAIEGDDTRGAIVGNSFDYDQTAGYGGQSNYGVGIYSSGGDGVRIAANSGRGRLGQVIWDDTTATTSTVRDAAVVGGAGLAALATYNTGRDIWSGGVATIATTGAGTTLGVTVSVAGNDKRGTISITTPGAGSPAAGLYALLTFSGVFPAAPIVQFSPGDNLAAALQPYSQTIAVGTAQFGLNVAPALGTTYRFTYTITG